MLKFEPATGGVEIIFLDGEEHFIRKGVIKAIKIRQEAGSSPVTWAGEIACDDLGHHYFYNVDKPMADKIRAYAKELIGAD